MTATASPTLASERARIAARNDKVCITLDRTVLSRLIDARVPGLSATMGAQQPHLFSDTAVFVARADVEKMQELVNAVEAVVRLPPYREEALRAAGRTFPTGTRGAFCSYDFHLTPAGPRLIEINTNAGGGVLSALQQQAQALERAGVKGFTMGDVAPSQIEDRFVDMLEAEWRLIRRDGALEHVAIVDDMPREQFLYPEFALFAAALERRGMQVVIADPRELMLCHGRLWHDETPIDLIYNRLTDFALAESAHTAVQEAYRHQHAVVTPHPQAHALYANKRNLVRLSDEQWLRDIHVPDEIVATLVECIPATGSVTPEKADSYWETRKQWFFKPATGFGSRAAYRGDKVTKRVFEEIATGGYVAQAFAPPAERRVETTDGSVKLKFDVRLFVYDGAVQLMNARLYQGQTTNFRTPGGGLAPLLYPAT